MMPKRLSPLIAASFVVLSMLACNFGTSSPVPASGTQSSSSTGNSSSGACRNSYFPIVVGATWDYKLTGPVNDSYTESILSADGSGFTEQSVFGTGATRQGKWNCANGSLTALDPTSGGSASVSTSNATGDFQTSDLSGVTIPASINPGDTWTQGVTLTGIETIHGQQYPTSNKFTNDCKAVGTESVTVQAGTFDALHVECQTNMLITITISGTSTQTPVNFNSTVWYVKNVGMVKTATSGSGINSTIELVSYKIP